MRRVTGFVIAVAVLLVADLGTPPLSPAGAAAWVDERGTALAAFAFVRLAALAIATLWLVAALAVAVATATGAVRVAAFAERVLPATFASLVAWSGVAAAQEPGTATMSVIEPEPETTTTTTASTTTTPTALPPAPVPAPAPEAPAEWVVAAGESFWSIAREVVGDALGRPPSDGEIAPYWRRLVEANRDRLVSPNPDLVHAGQVFVLPPVTP